MAVYKLVKILLMESLMESQRLFNLKSSGADPSPHPMYLMGSAFCVGSAQDGTSPGIGLLKESVCRNTSRFSSRKAFLPGFPKVAVAMRHCGLPRGPVVLLEIMRMTLTM